MIEGWYKVAEPAVEPVGLAQFKQHLRLSCDDEDTLLQACLSAARQRVEQESRRSLVSTTWKLCRSSWGCDGIIRLPQGRLQSVSLVTYVEPATGVRRTWDLEGYQVVTSSEPGFVLPAFGECWPAARTAPESVQITYVAGYGPAADDVPQPLRSAILLVAADLYEVREASVVGTIIAQNPAVQSLIAQYRLEEWRP